MLVAWLESLGLASSGVTVMEAASADLGGDGLTAIKWRYCSLRIIVKYPHEV